MGGFTFDRSKLKATSASAQQKQKNELASKGLSGGGKTEFIQIKEGEQTLRVFPFHPEGGGDNFTEVKCVSWLDVEVDKRDENGKKVEGEKEVKAKAIFNSKVHGGLDIDLVDEYITFAKERAIPDVAGDDKGLFKEIWGKIVGDKDKKPNKTDKYKPIRPTTSWVAYASKLEGVDAEGNMVWGKVCPWEIKKTIKDAMTEEAAEYNEPDPFSDPDAGIPVKVTYNPKASKPADYYKTAMLKKRVGNGFEYVNAPLSDDKLQEWFALEPLYKKYVNSFKRSDLLLQINGLERLDLKLNEDHPGFSVFQYSEFTDIVNALLDAFPEGADDDGKENEEEGGHEEPAPAAKAPVSKPTATKPAAAKPAAAPAKAATPTKPAVAIKPAAVIKPKPTPAPEPPQEEQEESGIEDDAVESAQQNEQEIKSTAVDPKSRLADLKKRMGRG